MIFSNIVGNAIDDTALRAQLVLVESEKQRRCGNISEQNECCFGIDVFYYTDEGDQKHNQIVLAGVNVVE